MGGGGEEGAKNNVDLRTKMGKCKGRKEKKSRRRIRVCFYIRRKERTKDKMPG